MNRIKLEVVIGLLGAVAFAVVCVIAFLKDVTSRLAILVSNAREIPTGKPLSRTVAGGDELSYLDGVLHSVASQLRTAADYRKSVMSMVAHDLRAPILSSKLSLEVLSSQRQTATIQSELPAIDGVKEDLNRIIVLLEDMLSIDKLEAGRLVLDMQAFDMEPLAQECVRMLAALSSAKGVTVSNTVASAIVVADRLRLMQVLQNLLANAIKYSPTGSTVTLSSQHPDGHLKLLVADSGPGIRREDQQKIFERFYTVESDSPDGFGLGLAISKLIVEQHGGHIGVDSASGEGSTFWFTVPQETD